LPAVFLLQGGMCALAELLVFYESPEAKSKENGKIASHIDEFGLQGRWGDPHHMLFLLALTNISQVKKILNWVKQQPGVKNAYLDLVEERVEQYEVFNQQLKRKLMEVRSAGLERLPLFLGGALTMLFLASGSMSDTLLGF